MIDLRIKCAWCGITIREGIGETSHGICSKCQKELEEDVNTFLQLQKEAAPDVAPEETK